MGGIIIVIVTTYKEGMILQWGLGSVELGEQWALPLQSDYNVSRDRKTGLIELRREFTHGTLLSQSPSYPVEHSVICSGSHRKDS